MTWGQAPWPSLSLALSQMRAMAPEAASSAVRESEDTVITRLHLLRQRWPCPRSGGRTRRRQPDAQTQTQTLRACATSGGTVPLHLQLQGLQLFLGCIHFIYDLEVVLEKNWITTRIVLVVVVGVFIRPTHILLGLGRWALNCLTDTIRYDPIQRGVVCIQVRSCLAIPRHCL